MRPLCVRRDPLTRFRKREGTVFLPKHIQHGASHSCLPCRVAVMGISPMPCQAGQIAFACGNCVTFRPFAIPLATPRRGRRLQLSDEDFERPLGEPGSSGPRFVRWLRKSWHGPSYTSGLRSDVSTPACVVSGFHTLRGPNSISPKRCLRTGLFRRSAAG